MISPCPIQGSAAPRVCSPSSRRARGFSLIELSVVLVLLTIVLGLGLGALNAQFQSAATTVSKQRQERIRQALIAHLGAAKKLPCADNPASGGVTGEDDCPTLFGVLPYATLGLARETAEDGWGNLFSYAVYAGSTPGCPGTAIDWTNKDCFGEGKSGGFIVKDGTVTDSTDLATGAIAVIISHGPNGLGAWTREATRNASPVTCEEALNSTQSVAGCTPAANTFYRGERADVDDIVAYINAGEAINELAHQGVLKPAAGRMAEDMQAAIDTVLGSFAALGDGCVNLPTAPAVGRDPWGKAYTASGVSGGATIYTITSDGSDGCSTCTPAVPSTTRTLTKIQLNAYLGKAGLATCPP